MSYIWPAIILLGIYHTIRIYRAGKASKEQYPAVEYLTRSSENSNPWRWRKPSDGLNLKLLDEHEKSSLVFDPQLNFTDYFVSVAGLVSYLGGVVFALMAVWYYFFGGAESGVQFGGSITLAVLGFFFGVVAHTVRQRVVSLSRTPDSLVLEYTYGSFIKRKVNFKKGAKVNIKVKDQSITEYDNSQETPFYELNISKKKLISLTPTKFYIAANQSQMSWLKGGLADWLNQDKKAAVSGKNTEIITADVPEELKETQTRDIENRPGA